MKIEPVVADFGGFFVMLVIAVVIVVKILLEGS